MKYLKQYKVFEKSEYPSHIDSEIIYTLKDITADLEDIGFFISISYSPITEPVISINIKIQKKEGGYFTFTEDISETLLRIYQYMRELGWYSNLKYNKSSIKKKFYIRPDDRMVDEDIAFIDNRWPGVSSIEMTWNSSNKESYYKFEGVSNDNINSLVKYYGDIIYDINKDIEFIEDKLEEIKDLGYFITVNYTPFTLSCIDKIPNIYFDIKKYKKGDFYGKNKELIDCNIGDIYNYMDENGYIVKNVFDGTEYKNEFNYIKSPTSYQVQFVKEDE